MGCAGADGGAALVGSPGEGATVLDGDHHAAQARHEPQRALHYVHVVVHLQHLAVGLARPVFEVMIDACRVTEETESRSNAFRAKVCKHCGATDLEAQYGKFGYYFLCKACKKNTGIKFTCPACSQGGRIRKQGKEFFAECKSCTASALFHTNA
jgi:hypothetical protein